MVATSSVHARGGLCWHWHTTRIHAIGGGGGVGGGVVGAVCLGKRRIYKSHDYVVLPPTVRTFVFICWGLLSEVINFFFKKGILRSCT